MYSLVQVQVLGRIHDPPLAQAGEHTAAKRYTVYKFYPCFSDVSGLHVDLVLK